MEVNEIEHILAGDFSEGTEWFRERLLQRCLAVLGQAEDEGVALEDDEIEFLAAAGVLFTGDERTDKDPL